MLSNGGSVALFFSDVGFYPLAILGVLRAGKSFVPIDPETPESRIKQLLIRCHVTLILTEVSLADKLNGIFEPSNCIFLDEVESEFNQAERDEVYVSSGNTSSLDDVAYILHTSGTTGEPKGIAITHKNLLPLLFWQNTVFVRGEKLDHLLLLSPTFDFGLQDILIAILFGGTLHIQKSRAFDALQIAQKINDAKISSLYATPSMFDALLPQGPFPTVRVALSGGETLSWKTGEMLVNACAKNARIFNGYGPTEASINCLMFNVDNRSRRNFRNCLSVPIGKVSGLSRVSILDKWSRPVPPGVKGEIVIGGPGVCSGYLGEKKLGSAKFKLDVKSNKANELLYYSGDFAIMLPNGDVEFLGRIDHQVKVRGYRVEISEIEEVLMGIGTMSNCAVLPEPGKETECLVAFVVPAAGASIDLDHVKRCLFNMLPRYMVPKRISAIESLPLNSNGKLDRNKLLEIATDQFENERTEAHVDDVRTLTDLEIQVLGLWKAELGKDDLSVGQSFFDVGGHSLVVARLHAKITRIASVEMSIGDFFEYDTIEKLCSRIEFLKSTGSTKSKLTELNAVVELSVARRKLLRRANSKVKFIPF